MNTIRKKYYSLKIKKLETTNVNGFESFRTYNFNAGIGTTIYGTF